MTVHETTLRFAALSEAMCDVLASVAADNAILRSLLHTKGMVTDTEFEAARADFKKQGQWQLYRDKIAKDIREKTDAKLRSLRGPVN